MDLYIYICIHTRCASFQFCLRVRREPGTCALFPVSFSSKFTNARKGYYSGKKEKEKGLEIHVKENEEINSVPGILLLWLVQDYGTIILYDLKPISPRDHEQQSIIRDARAQQAYISLHKKLSRWDSKPRVLYVYTTSKRKGFADRGTSRVLDGPVPLTAQRSNCSYNIPVSLLYTMDTRETNGFPTTGM